MGELPVDHRREAVLVDDEVAEAEVAVDEARLDRLGSVRAQPAQSELDRGQRLADLVQLALPFLDLGDGRVALGCRQHALELEPDRSSGSGRGRRASWAVRRPGLLELRLAQDARRDRGPVDEGHQHSRGAEAPSARLRTRSAGERGRRPRRLAIRANSSAIGTSDTEPSGSRRRTHRSLALDQPGLARGPSGDRLEIEITRVGAALGRTLRTSGPASRATDRKPNRAFGRSFAVRKKGANWPANRSRTARARGPGAGRGRAARPAGTSGG